MNFRSIFLSGHATKAHASIRISVARNSKVKRKSFRKRVEKIYLVRKLFSYFLAAYYCAKRLTTCTKGETVMFKFGVRFGVARARREHCFCLLFVPCWLICLFQSSPNAREGERQAENVGSFTFQEADQLFHTFLYKRFHKQFVTTSPRNYIYHMRYIFNGKFSISTFLFAFMHEKLN